MSTLIWLTALTAVGLAAWKLGRGWYIRNYTLPPGYALSLRPRKYSNYPDMVLTVPAGTEIYSELALDPRESARDLTRFAWLHAGLDMSEAEELVRRRNGRSDGQR